MLGKRKLVETGKKVEPTKYKFNISDPVHCTDFMVKNAVVISRYNVSGENFYKVRNLLNQENIKVCKEKDLLHR